MMFARLRSAATTGRLVQHVVRATDADVVMTWCGVRFNATDLDPGYAEVMAGNPCPMCLACAPVEVTARFQRVCGDLADDPLADSSGLAGDLDFASGVAVLRVRHVVPPNAGRFRIPLSDRERVVLVVECGHIAYCPVTGPKPSTLWPICAGCAQVVRWRTAIDVPVDSRKALPPGVSVRAFPPDGARPDS